MALISVEELSRELSIPVDLIVEMIDKKIIIPYGGRARLGEPRFCRDKLSEIQLKLETYTLAH